MSRTLNRDQYKATRPKGWDPSRESVVSGGKVDHFKPNKHKTKESKVTSTEAPRPANAIYFPASMDRKRKIKVGVLVAGTIAHVLSFTQDGETVFTLRNGDNIDFTNKDEALSAYESVEKEYEEKLQAYQR